MIKEADDTGKLFGEVYQVHAFGHDNPSWVCGDFGSNENAKGLLVCEGFAIAGDSFKYNPSTGHFLATRTAGYVHTFDDGRVADDTPSIEIGKCSKL